MKSDDIKEARNKAALDYHEFPTPGKLSITATKQLLNQSDLALAYSPGVAAACEAIVADPLNVFRFTARGNLVGVISNGTAVLGLGAIGPLAAKPVMEGKAVLFKKFAGIDVFDIEIEQRDPQKLVEIIAALEPTFGAINLEDIKAPECFIVERELRRRMKIPVFHDDQHGTAIIVGAACLNGLQVVGKDIAQGQDGGQRRRRRGARLRRFAAGSGARARERLADRSRRRRIRGPTGIDGSGKGALRAAHALPAHCARSSAARTFSSACSAGGVLSQEMVKMMAARPLILALANPTPEILPEEVRAVRDDAVIATGRSDYPNQVNNVLCFPFIFRGALDVGATTITRQMEIATVHAIAELARQEQSDIVAAAYGGIEDLAFGPEYLIPKPFDPRLIVKIAPAVAQRRHGVRRGHAANRRLWKHTASGCCNSCITAAR